MGFILIVRLLRSPTNSHSSFRDNNGVDRHSNRVSSMPASHLMRGSLITFEGVMSDIRVTNMVCSWLRDYIIWPFWVEFIWPELRYRGRPQGLWANLGIQLLGVVWANNFECSMKKEYIWIYLAFVHPNSILVAQPLTTNFDVVMGYQTYQNISKHIKQLLLIRRRY